MSRGTPLARWQVLGLVPRRVCVIYNMYLVESMISLLWVRVLMYHLFFFSSYYSDRGVCVRCHGSCASCSGPLATDCTSCSSGFSWLQQRCLSQCPMGYYNVSINSLIDSESQTQAKSASFFCARCHGSCQVCENNSIYCQACADGFTPVNATCISTNIQ